MIFIYIGHTAWKWKDMRLSNIIWIMTYIKIDLTISLIVKRTAKIAVWFHIHFVTHKFAVCRNIEDGYLKLWQIIEYFVFSMSPINDCWVVHPLIEIFVSWTSGTSFEGQTTVIVFVWKAYNEWIRMRIVSNLYIFVWISEHKTMQRSHEVHLY